MIVDIVVAVVAALRSTRTRRLVAGPGSLAAGIAEAEDSPGRGRASRTGAWDSRRCIAGCIGCCRGPTLCVVF
jgi:hypothetical protein